MSEPKLNMQEEIVRRDAIVRLVGDETVRRVVGRFAARHRFLADEFAQEAALAIVKAHARLLEAECHNRLLAHITWQTCITVLRREFRRPLRHPGRPQSRRPVPRRRDLQDVLRDLNGREPRPDFQAALREELGDLERVPAPRPPAATTGHHLDPEQRGVLRQLLLGEPAWTAREIAAEFHRRTGRTLDPQRVSKYRRTLGLKADPRLGVATKRRRFEAGAHDWWDVRGPRVV